MTYTDILNDLGLDSVISPQNITSSTIPRYVRARENSNGTHIDRLYRLIDGKAEAIEFVARKGDSHIGIPLMKLNNRKGSLVSVIVHQGKIIIPFGKDHIEEGDHVIIISRDLGISDLNEVLYQ